VSVVPRELTSEDKYRVLADLMRSERRLALRPGWAQAVVASFAWESWRGMERGWLSPGEDGCTARARADGLHVEVYAPGGRDAGRVRHGVIPWDEVAAIVTGAPKQARLF